MRRPRASSWGRSGLPAGWEVPYHRMGRASLNVVKGLQCNFGISYTHACTCTHWLQIQRGHPSYPHPRPTPPTKILPPQCPTAGSCCKRKQPVGSNSLTARTASRPAATAGILPSCGCLLLQETESLRAECQAPWEAGWWQKPQSPSNQTTAVTCLLPGQEGRGLGGLSNTRQWAGPMLREGFPSLSLMTTALCESHLSTQKSLQGHGGVAKSFPRGLCPKPFRVSWHLKPLTYAHCCPSGMPLSLMWLPPFLFPPSLFIVPFWEK